MLEPFASAPASAAAVDGEPRARVAVIGMSIASTCGMRDHATLLAGALERRRVACSMHWLTREAADFASARAQVRAWTEELAAALADARANAALLHYSPFAYGHRGVPLFARSVLGAIRSANLPLLCVAHELAYPWGREGIRGRVWAITQRAASRGLVAESQAMLVTADFQREWLATRRWLPARPALVAPVFSNLPPPGPVERRPGKDSAIGLFGYAYQGAERDLVLDALASLRERGLSPRLLLLGAPGGASATAAQWLAAARSRGIERQLDFHGPLPAQQLSDELAACAVLLSCARLGPSSRKGTLAGSLASGTAVVALDGPLRWQELVDAGAAEVVAPSARALADALGALLRDERRRAEVGARGRAFAQSRMSLQGTADAVLELLARTRTATAAGRSASLALRGAPDGEASASA
jgi:hypothetical protein